MRKYTTRIGSPESRACQLLALSAILAAACLPGCDSAGQPRALSEAAPLRLLLVDPEHDPGNWAWVVAGAECLAADAPIEIIRSDYAGALERLRAQQGIEFVVLPILPGGAGAERYRELATYPVGVIVVGDRPPEPAAGWVRWSLSGPEDLARTMKSNLGDSRSYILGADGERKRLAFEGTARLYFDLHRLSAHDLPRPGDRALEQLRAGLAEYPHTGVLVTLTAAPWDGLAVQAYGELPPVITLGATPGMWAAIEAGEIRAALGALDGDVGRAVVRLALDIAASPATAERVATVPYEEVTSGNLAAFAARYAAAVCRPVETLLPAP